MITSCHNFAHATTAELSWHAQSCDMTASLKTELEERELSQDLIDKLLTQCEMGHCLIIRHQGFYLYKGNWPLGIQWEGLLQGSHLTYVINSLITDYLCRWALGLYLSWWPPSNMCVSPVIFLSATTGMSE